jgi:hypothetical protein
LKLTKIISSYYIFSLLIIIVTYCISFGITNFSKADNRIITAKCTFVSQNYTSVRGCFQYNTPIVDPFFHCLSSYSNQSTTSNFLRPSVKFQSPIDGLSKHRVEPLQMPSEKYHHIGEPSFSSNGSLVFYAGNHYAAQSIVGDWQWKYQDPAFDFKMVNIGNITGNTVIADLFKADQRVGYAPHQGIYIWIRQGKAFVSGNTYNIERLSVSRDGINWVVYDLSPDIYTGTDISSALFDYPELVIGKNYLYITASTVLSCSKAYGTIFRLSLNDLGNSTLNKDHLSFHYDVILDRNVTAISPVDAASDPMYFGSQMPNNDAMKLYIWYENMSSPTNRTVNIDHWNDIHNANSCGENSQSWWCRANTSSHIRSAWLFNHSINFLWNALTTYDKGMTWMPYTDVATFKLDNNMSYERKYYLADPSTEWIFGSAIPNDRQDLGIITFYVNSSAESSAIVHPHLNLAFGVYNLTENKWDMMPLINSSSSLPVINETGGLEYGAGDFLTIRKHIGAINDSYLWDAAGYVLEGQHYYDAIPYFFMIK